MKKVFILSASTIFLAYTASAQSDLATLKKDEKHLNKEEKVVKHEKKEEKHEMKKLKEGEVSYFSQQQFYSDFGNMPAPEWKKEGVFDVATFTKDGITQSAYYDVDNHLVGTTIRKSFADLPDKAQEFINKKYKDYTKDAVIFFNDNQFNETDMILYGQKFDDADNYFVELAKNGKRIVLRSDIYGRVEFFKELK